MRWQVWRCQAIDIWPKNVFPTEVLSNLCSNDFRFNAVVRGCMGDFNDRI